MDTHIVERLADYINDGRLDSTMIHVESEHSAISACIGVEATGVRTFTATSSQGLALMYEILFVASGMRLPIVMAVANRALSAPINIWGDHQDSISTRDAGWIQLFVESSQEALDTAIQAYKIAENKKVLLPLIVGLDGFTLSHVYEPADVPSQKDVDNFLPKFNPLYKLDPKKPVSMGPIGFPNTFMEFREQQQKAMENALNLIREVNSQFKKSFGRSYGNGLVETYKIDDAEYALAAMGTVCGTARVVIDELREKGKKVGLIKLKSLRPFPAKDIQKIASHLKGIAVIDRSISPGFESGVCSEFRSSLFDQNMIINGFVAGLGGRDVTPAHLKKALNNLDKNKKTIWLK